MPGDNVRRGKYHVFTVRIVIGRNDTDRVPYPPVYPSIPNEALERCVKIGFYHQLNGLDKAPDIFIVRVEVHV